MSHVNPAASPVEATPTPAWIPPVETPTPAPKKDVATLIGYAEVSCYTTTLGERVTIHLEKRIAEEFRRLAHADGALSLRLDFEWDGEGSSVILRPHIGKRFHVPSLRADNCVQVRPPTQLRMEPFSTVQTTVLLACSEERPELLVNLPEIALRHKPVPRRRHSSGSPPEEKVAPVEDVTTPEAEIGRRDIVGTEAYIRLTLWRIRHIESQMGYHLVRTEDGQVAFDPEPLPRII